MKKLLQGAVLLILIGSLTLDFDHGLQIKAAYAQADNILTISWTPPTQYEDNTPLLMQDMDFYTFSCDGTQLAVIDNIIGVTTAGIDMSAMEPGNYTCHLTITALAVVNPVGAESGPSNTINFTMGDRVPGSPAGLTRS